MSITQDIIDFSGLPEKLQASLEAMKAYAFESRRVLELERDILRKFSAHAGQKDDYLPSGQRVAIAAGWIIEKDGKTLLPMFSRNAEMYIGDKYLSTPDVAVQTGDVDVLTASRVIFPNGGYTPGGKVAAFRENQDFLDLSVKFISQGKSFAFEFNHESQEICYMPVGVMLFNEPDDWFIQALEKDPNVFFISPEEIDENMTRLPLTAKAEIFLDMAKKHINKNI